MSRIKSGSLTISHHEPIPGTIHGNYTKVELSRSDYVVKVSRHNKNEIEIKTFLRSQAFFRNGAKIIVTTHIPRSLGSISKDAFAESLWTLNRCGFQQNFPLLEIFNSWESWRKALLDSIQLLSTSGDNAGVGISRNERIQDLSIYEHGVRILGCLLKSGIRDESKQVKSILKSGEGIDQIEHQRIQETFHMFERIISLLDILRKDVKSMNIDNRLPKVVTSQLEEFILGFLETECAQLCTNIDKDLFSELYESACNVSLKANRYLSQMENSSLQWEENNDLKNESYAYQLQELKHYFVSTLYLTANGRKTSFLFADIVGMAAAGTAMLVSLLILWSAELKYDKFSLGLFFVLVLGYILKDRLKEWSKRYIIPLVKQPYRTTELLEHYGKGKSKKAAKVGTIKEWMSVSESIGSQYDSLVRSRRCSIDIDSGEDHSDADIEPTVRSKLLEPRPETVLKYTRDIQLDYLNWKRRTSFQAFKSIECFNGCYEDGMSLVQITRMNFKDYFAKMNSPSKVHSVIDPLTKTPISITCPQTYSFRLSVDVKVGSPPKRWLNIPILGNDNNIETVETDRDCTMSFVVSADRNGIIRILSV